MFSYEQELRQTTQDCSVYEVALGERFFDLSPALQRYFGAIPAGATGAGSGIYEVAGSRRWWLRPLLAVAAQRQILFPEFGRGIPFHITNTAEPDGARSGVRTFEFPGRTRVLADTMAVIDGRLVERLGRRRELEVWMDVAVADGGLRMTSGRCWLHLAGLRIPLPPLARVTVDERLDPERPGHQRVDVRMTAPLIGEVFRYTGSFTYEVA